MKERNLDDAINEKARFGFTWTRGCEVRKLDAKHCQASRKKRSPQKKQNRKRRRNKKAIPSVSVVVYLNGNETGNRTSSLAGSRERGVIVESLSSSRVSASTAGSSRRNENVSRASRTFSGNLDAIYVLLLSLLLHYYCEIIISYEWCNMNNDCCVSCR